MKKLNVKALAFSFGIAWLILIFIIGIISSLSNWGVEFVNLVSSIYPGFAPTFLGSIIGGIWGFLSGLVWGGIIGSFYNKLI